MIHNWCHFASLCGLLLLQVSQQQQQGLHLRAVSLSPVPPKLVIDRLYASTANEDPVRIPEHESQLPLVLALEVEEWCSIDDISEECVPLTDLVACVWTTSDTGHARQFCSLLDMAMKPGSMTLSTGHLPIGNFNVSVRLYASCNSTINPSQGWHRLVHGRDSRDAEIRAHRSILWDSIRTNEISALLQIDSSRMRDTSSERGTEGSASTSDSTKTGLRLGLLRHGPLLFNVKDYPAGISLELQGEWEESVVRLLTSVLRVGDFAVDVGAHLGSFTIPLAKAVGQHGSGRVLSLEPQQDLFQSLNANLALNGLNNVQAVRAAASHYAPSNNSTLLNTDWPPAAFLFGAAQAGTYRTIPIRNTDVTSNFGSYSLLDSNYDSPQQQHLLEGDSCESTMSKVDWFHGDDEVQVDIKAAGTTISDQRKTTFPIIALDELRVLKERCPALIKVDVEGMEASVVWGARETIKRCRPILYLENQCRSASSDLLTLLSGRQTEEGLGNYACFWDPAPYFAPDNFLGLKDGTRIGGGVSLNMICISREDSIDTVTTSFDLKSRLRAQWMILRDVLDELSEISPSLPLVEDYNPVRLRSDSGVDGPLPHEVYLQMADC